MISSTNSEIQNQQISFIQKFINSYKERTLFSVLLTIFLILFLYGIFSTDNYLTIFNFKTIIRDAALYGIMAIGLTFVTLSGNFFLLSIKETASICCVAFAVGMSTGFGIEAFEGNFYISLLVALSIGLIAGAIQ